MVQITTSAAEQIRAAIANAADPDLLLRLAARQLEDGDLDFGLGLDERREQDHEIVTEAGITLLVSPPSRDAVEGVVIDYVEIAPGEMRFIFYRGGDAEPRGAQPEGDGAAGCTNCGCGGPGKTAESV